MSIVAIITTAIAWTIGWRIGEDSTMAISLSTLFAIITMGSFILKAIKDISPDRNSKEK
ncbi:MAG: hypothetical protein AAGU27_08580 [Dehalobacterium sp.]